MIGLLIKTKYQFFYKTWKENIEISLITHKKRIYIKLELKLHNCYHQSSYN